MRKLSYIIYSNRKEGEGGKRWGGEQINAESDYVMRECSVFQTIETSTCNFENYVFHFFLFNEEHRLNVNNAGFSKYRFVTEFLVLVLITLTFNVYKDRRC